MGKRTKYGTLHKEKEFQKWLIDNYELKENVALDYIYRGRQLQFILDKPLNEITEEKVKDIDKSITKYIEKEKRTLSINAKYAFKNNMTLTYRRYMNFLEQIDDM